MVLPVRVDLEPVTDGRTVERDEATIAERAVGRAHIAAGPTAGLLVVAEAGFYAACSDARKRERVRRLAISRTPSARTVALLMTVGRDRLTKAETITVAAIETSVELLVEARALMADFQAMIRRKALAELDPSIEHARTSLIASFANGVTKDKAAVSAAISMGWSNGQAEGQICKLKLVRCTGEENSICSKRASSAPRRPSSKVRQSHFSIFRRRLGVNRRRLTRLPRVCPSIERRYCP